MSANINIINAKTDEQKPLFHPASLTAKVTWDGQMEEPGDCIALAMWKGQLFAA
jgi:hypothetical protein